MRVAIAKVKKGLVGLNKGVGFAQILPRKQKTETGDPDLHRLLQQPLHLYNNQYRFEISTSFVDRYNNILLFSEATWPLL